MTKNFIEVGGIYKSNAGWDWECICIKGDHAWLVLDNNINMSAYAFNLDGTPVKHQDMDGHRILPPKPKIAQNDANLYNNGGDWALMDYWSDEGINGKLYTHPEDGVAIFVPLNIDGETLAEAIGALQGEIGDE